MRTEKLINCSTTSKYIDAEKLIAEIDRLMGLLPKEQGININLDWARNTLVALHQFIDSHQQEQPKVDYNKFEKLFHDFCESNKGHHITSHDACMWFWELGLKGRKEVQP